MADSRYAGELGLSAVFGQIKQLIAGKVDKEAGKGLSKNDYDDEAKAIVDGVEAQIDEINSNISDHSNIYAQFGCKNLNAYPYYQSTRDNYGIRFTDNGDGSITVSGTNNGLSSSTFDCHYRTQGENNSLILPNGYYIISGCPSGGGSSSYELLVQCTKNSSIHTIGRDTGSGVKVLLNGDDFSNDYVDIQIRIVVYQNVAFTEPITFYPMLRLATVKDGTWEPYNNSNKQLTNGLESVESDLINKAFDVGAPIRKNVATMSIEDIKARHSSGTWSGNTYAISGFTTEILVDSDGLITGFLVKGSDNQTSNLSMVISPSDWNSPIPSGILTGCPSGGSDTTYRLVFYKSASILYRDTGEGVNVPISDGRIRIVVAKETVVPAEGLLFKPMLRSALYDDTYAPYIPSVEDRLEEAESNITNLTKSLIYESESTGTFATKLQSVRTAYGNLTSERKKGSYLDIGGILYRITMPSYGIFSAVMYSGSANEYVIRSVELDTVRFSKMSIKTAGNTYTDLLSDETSDTVKLYA